MKRHHNRAVKSIVVLLFALGVLSLTACAGGHTHIPKENPAKEPTCTECGNRAYYICSDCKGAFADAECRNGTTEEEQRIPALGHLWDSDCDTACGRDGCGATRSAGSHTDANEDGKCDSCGKNVSADLPVTGGEDVGLPKNRF